MTTRPSEAVWGPASVWRAAHHTDRMERNRQTAMPTAKQFTIETVNLDDDREMDEFDRQVIAAGMERVRAEIQELGQKSLLNAQFPEQEYVPAQRDPEIK